ncbi:MAG: hypothetical protein FJW69_09070 [Actinobacteria bacterium]|nr:hypothetical protein [Actinomycetota bacterium]
MIAIQVSLYPIGEKDIDEKLNIFWETLRAENINFKITPLSTIIWSEAADIETAGDEKEKAEKVEDREEEKLYNSVLKAYMMVRRTCPAVMVSTITTGDKISIEKLLKFLK